MKYIFTKFKIITHFQVYSHINIIQDKSMNLDLSIIKIIIFSNFWFAHLNSLNYLSLILIKEKL